MSRKFRMLISVVLTVILAFSAALPAFAVRTAEVDLPIVYVKGAGREIYAADGTKIMPFDIEPEDQIMAQAEPLLKAFANSVLLNDWSIYCDKLTRVVKNIYKELVLDENGEATDGSYIIPSPAPKKKTSNFVLSDYIFNYDSRLDPWEVAESMDEYIDSVLEATGKDKVQLVGRCLGGNYVAAYLTRYGAEKIDACVLYVPSTMGTVVCSGTFSGSFKFDPDIINDYVDTNLTDGSDLSGLINSIVSVTHSMSILHMGTDLAESVYRQIANQLIPDLLMYSYATMPAYWSMVDDEHFERAKNFVFGDNKAQYAGLIEKIDNYHYNVMNEFDVTLRQLQEDGVKVAVVAKYNTALPPIFENSDAQADGTIELDKLSFGATSAKMNDTLSRAYLNSIKQTGAIKYVSKDLVIDASTCVLPDSTWFIKNSVHEDFNTAINKLIYAILGSEEQLTVWDDPNYPQFLDYDKQNNKLTAVTKAEANGDTGNENFNFIERLVAAFQKIILFFRSLFGILN